MSKFNLAKHEEVLLPIIDQIDHHLYEASEVIVSNESHKKALIELLLSIKDQCKETILELEDE